jgi:hypothetical protein
MIFFSKILNEYLRLLSLLLLVVLFNLYTSLVQVNCQNVCFTDKRELPQTTNPNRVVLTFECYSGSRYNPLIPINNGSHPREYNELDLSPNLYDRFVLDELCPFVNIYLFDISYNRLTSLTNAFVELSCLQSLKHLDLSNNQIRTPLLASDFLTDNESFSINLEYLNMNNNQIPSIESSVFLLSDGTARFKKLSFLGLANNRLKELDLLWPMIMPNNHLVVDLSNNNIKILKNELSSSRFDEDLFVPMTSNRSVDIRNNSLFALNDSNLLQYKINNQYDFEKFLFKLSNYDFSQIPNGLECDCSVNNDSNTVFWYRLISNRIADKMAPIYQLNCKRIPLNYIFDYDCSVSRASSL